MRNIENQISLIPKITDRYFIQIYRKRMSSSDVISPYCVLIVSNSMHQKQVELFYVQIGWP